ncbi:linear amide C-N hydrolase [Enterobacter asburiae]|uniref:linear amide C-N hydrolase n=1 Tax=Enterobacter asburiae TaxID=61645 RepID=UPI00192BECF2|nr:linear amide C-N hydrolase [Enterobacter asburiae]MBL5950317.1 linear amide C-N hydrolase [Enterobacter asburiae]
MKKLFLLLLLLPVFLSLEILACSRVLWSGNNGLVITGRTMDWPYPFDTHMFIFPRNTLYKGGSGFATWRGKYGTVSLAGATTPGKGIDAVFDGVNEHGLVANLLYLGETEFPKPGRKKISFAAWVQYVLSNFKNVDEAIVFFSENKISIVPFKFGPGGVAKASVHLSLSDSSGDSAVIEYIDGKATIHHGKNYTVMTNSPEYDKQLTLNSYWEKQDGNLYLPGSHQSEDRFVRASFYLKNLPKEMSENSSVASIFSIIRNVSVPWGVKDDKHPNLSPTYWRSVVNHKSGVYFFESATSPSVIWLNYKNIDFTIEGIRALSVENRVDLHGDISKYFTKSKGIAFLEN